MDQREELIQCARNCGEGYDRYIAYENSGPGRLEFIEDRELYLACETIALNGFGDEQYDGYTLVGHVVIWNSPTGFAQMQVCEDADRARRYFEGCIRADEYADTL